MGGPHRRLLEAGINEKGVSCSATLSTSYNEDAKAADPIDEDYRHRRVQLHGSVILGQSANAREGVELLGSLIDEQGTCTNDQIIIADNNETWLFATLSAHQWIAMKLADDVASLNPNIGSLNYDVDLNDTENCLHSKDIESMPVEKGFAKYPLTVNSMSPKRMAKASPILALTNGPAMCKAAIILLVS